MLVNLNNKLLKCLLVHKQQWPKGTEYIHSSTHLRQLYFMLLPFFRGKQPPFNSTTCIQQLHLLVMFQIKVLH